MSDVEHTADRRGGPPWPPYANLRPPRARATTGACPYPRSNPKFWRGRAWAGRPCHGGAAGFTLVELLVALTIFVTVMASVALAFSTAIRTSKQGFQNQEAFELARGMMKVLERDLSRAFTNRDHGDNFSFYGTPIGFTYVGLISADDSPNPNMSRVTYVVYHDPSLANLSGAFDPYTYESTEGSEIPTYQLLRYIEPGADSLDSFPIDWSGIFTSDNTNQPAPWEAMATAAVNRAGCASTDAGCQELVRQAARREVWIKMLAGGGDVMEFDADGDGIAEDTFTLPNAWSFLGLGDPADYVVGENIRYMNSGLLTCAADQATLETLVTIDFDDRVFTNSLGQACVLGIGDVGLTPIFAPTWTAVFDSSSGPRPFFTYWDIGTIVRDPTTTVDDDVTPIAFQFWNDWRNLVADGLDNDFDTLIDEDDERYGENSGSPLDTRLPIAVTTDFTLFFRSPYVGAPDFNERFTQRIDLPVGSRRSFKAPATAP